ncbi:hypothetical protein PSTT_16742 [Puccinia striiformis]|uniref:Uncharacterized protein n=1 Tax=Puccinia striiformis TaxID=27350 RepID=A0A2S4UBI3_9BASI|nr:hypothetical protein PSTT_16742 [Puccinia striiformis]
MAGHSSDKNQCSFCCVTKDEIDAVDLDHICPRNARVLRKQAIKWKNTVTLADWKAIFQTYGVRYSVLYELPYFDPLSNAAVEPMITSFWVYFSTTVKISLDLRYLPKIQNIKQSDENDLETNRPEGSQRKCKGKQRVGPSESVEELLASFQELQFPFACSSESAPDTKLNLPTGTDLEESEDDNEDESADDNEDESADQESLFFGKAENLQRLRDVNQEIQLPRWIGRVPSTVGAAKGGKLKADEWVVLFEIIMIPTLTSILFESHYVFHVAMFENLLHLTSIVNIVQSLKIDNNDIKYLRLHLKGYRQGLLDIYPSFSTKPNHHLALHLPDCLCQFGPAPQWTAWSFERLNGSLAPIPTNNHIETRDLTLLRQWVTAQNFRNILPYLCQHLPKAMSKPLLDFVKPSKSVGQFSQAMNKLETLDLETHELLVRSFNHKFSSNAQLCTSIYTSWTRNKTTILIPRLVHQQKSITFGHTTYTLSDQHAGNSTILYYILDTKGARQDVHGQISQIFTMSYSTKKDTPRQIHLWFEVERYNDLSPADRKKHNFKDWPYVKARVVYNLKKKKDYIQMDHVIGHTATWQLPPACFGIGRKALFVVDLSKNSLHPLHQSNE